MSKKVVIVPKHKWCVCVATPECGEMMENYEFLVYKNRSTARWMANQEPVGTVRKVSKIVYYYE